MIAQEICGVGSGGLKTDFVFANEGLSDLIGSRRERAELGMGLGVVVQPPCESSDYTAVTEALKGHSGRTDRSLSPENGLE